jgi:hypothetical protein
VNWRTPRYFEVSQRAPVRGAGHKALPGTPATAAKFQMLGSRRPRPSSRAWPA